MDANQTQVCNLLLVIVDSSRFVKDIYNITPAKENASLCLCKRRGRGRIKYRGRCWFEPGKPKDHSLGNPEHPLKMVLSGLLAI